MPSWRTRGRAPSSAGPRQPRLSSHHIYSGGLLEHTLSVVRLLDRAAAHYQGIDRDLLITGGILHDIGKIHEFPLERMVDTAMRGD